MAEAVRWWLWLEALGLAGLPLCGLLFRSLPDRGYSLSKVFGWLAAGWLAWLAASVRLAPFGSATARSAVLVLALLSAGALMLHKGGYYRAWRAYFRERILYVLAVEVAFLLAFAALVLLRGRMPQIRYTEKPMEYMYLQAAYSARAMPPPDLWLSGHDANYYYFGFYLHAFVARLSGVSPAVGFNLALASTWAMTLLALAGIGYNAAAAAGALARIPRVLAAGLAPLLVLGVGNPAGTLEWWRSWREGGGFDWFGAPTRVIADNIPGRPGPTDTINEFPAFSFLLGDLHPHLMAMPLLALGLASSLALALYVTRPRAQLIVGAAAAGFVCGCLYMTNSWDVPVVLGLALAAPAVASSGRGAARLRPALLALAPMLLGALATALPFAISFEAPVNRSADLPAWAASLPLVGTVGRLIGPVWWDHTGLSEFLRVWGVHVLLLLLVLVAHARTVGLRGWAATAVAAGLALAPAGLLDAPLLLLLVPVIVLALYGAWCHPSMPMRWAFLLLAAGWALVLLPEVVYLRDAFEDRMNTVFKLYYQAWQVLGVSYSLLVVSALDSLSVRLRAGRRLPVLAPVVAVVLLVSLSYWYAGTKELAGGGYQGLDGTSFLQTEDPDAYAAAQWLRGHTDPRDVVLEATGKAYSLYARLATYGGRPTVLGWANHEDQWHLGHPELLDEIARRDRDIGRLYGPGDPAQKRALLERYGVRYAYYGSLEREMQLERRLPVRDPFAGWLTPVLRGEGSVLYEAPRAAAAD